MKIKNKLSYGMGALFGMILFLGLVSVGYIVKISADTQSIYDNNNNSLDYARNMLTALETIGTDDAARAIFQENLERQKRNITEDDEKDVTRKTGIALYGIYPNGFISAIAENKNRLVSYNEFEYELRPSETKNDRGYGT